LFVFLFKQRVTIGIKRESVSKDEFCAYVTHDNLLIVGMFNRPST
jgi:hypothetical protein